MTRDISFAKLQNLAGKFSHSRETSSMSFDFDVMRISHTFKPANGIYCSPMRSYNGIDISEWEQWNADHGTGDAGDSVIAGSDSVYRFQISLKDEAPILLILTQEDIELLKKKYSFGNLYHQHTLGKISSPVILKYLNDMRSSIYYFTRHAICWAVVALDYSGVFFSASFTHDDLLKQQLQEATGGRRMSASKLSSSEETMEAACEDHSCDFDVNTLVVFDKTFTVEQCTPFKLDLMENKNLIESLPSISEAGSSVDPEEAVYDNASGISL